MNVLIVDDSRAMRMIIRRTLRQAGFDGGAVWEAANGKEALEMMVAEMPDLVLCDWNMPVMSGIALLELLTEKGVRVPFGFVTSQGTPAMRERARRAGAWFVISKPFTVETFEVVLGRLQGAA